MSHIPVVPALIPESQQAVLDAARQFTFAQEFHLDLVDGQFVTTVSWPYEPVGDAAAVAIPLSAYTLEVDLMVAKPVEAAETWLRAGADMLVFHVETLPLEVFANFTDRCTHVSVGVSAHGGTSLETLAEYAELADYVQLMGIYEIGAQGQPFDRGVFDKISWIKEHFPNLPITVDGSVNQDTIVELSQAGVDRFICGSAIVKQPDPAAAHAALSALING